MIGAGWVNSDLYSILRLKPYTAYKPLTPLHHHPTPLPRTPSTPHPHPSSFTPHHSPNIIHPSSPTLITRPSSLAPHHSLTLIALPSSLTSHHMLQKSCTSICLFCQIDVSITAIYCIIFKKCAFLLGFLLFEKIFYSLTKISQN